MSTRLAAICQLFAILLLGSPPVVAENWGAAARAHPHPSDPASFRSWITTLQNDRDPASRAAVQVQFGKPSFAGDTKQVAGLVRVNKGGKPVDVQVLITVKQTKGSPCVSYSGSSSAARPLAYFFGCAGEAQPWGIGTLSGISQPFASISMFPTGAVGVNGVVRPSPYDAAAASVQIAMGFSNQVRPTAVHAEAMMASAEAIYSMGQGAVAMPLLETFAWTGYLGSLSWPAF